jgi:ABC-type multidrug transport system ATPase subunit
MRPITVQNVTKSYGPTNALDGVSLTFDPGSVNAVLGPNGSGKTTLFRILLGLTRADSGAVSLPDVPVGCVFQQPQYFGGLTVAENLQLFVSLTDASPEWHETLVERCGLDRVRHRLVDDLSDGFLKRLDVALALIDRPGLVLLDEPFADIDEEYRGGIRRLLDDYMADDRIFVVTTHQFDAVASMLDTVTVLDAGRVRARASVADLGGTADDIAAYYRSVLAGEDGQAASDRGHEQKS